jgi:monofunctional glycosyltransferase
VIWATRGGNGTRLDARASVMVGAVRAACKRVRVGQPMRVDAIRAEPVGLRRTPMKPRKPWWRRLLRVGIWLVIAFIVTSLLAVIVLRFVPVPTSAFMVDRRIEAIVARDRDFRIEQRWVPYERIAPVMPLAVVASEDQRFPRHHGFDLDAIADALEERERGERQRGASTISQQVAKNLFLWSAPSWPRKALEAYFTVLIEVCWPKQRILEVYLNIAEFGDGIYGVEAASQRYFRKAASRLTETEAARLAAVLPNPRKLRVERPTAFINERIAWIRRQMHQLGGPDYLDAPPPPATKGARQR